MGVEVEAGGVGGRPDRALRGAYDGWRALAGPLADFVLPMPFLAEASIAPVRPFHPGAARLAEALARIARSDGGAAVFLEAAPRLGLAVGPRLMADGWWVVPMYSRWPVSGAVLPTRPLAGWLAWLAENATGRAQADSERRPVAFLLDAERNRPASARALRRRFDNRYGYLAHMLPPALRLGEWGVRRAIWVGGTASVPPDLAGYVESLVQAGMVVEVERVVPESGRLGGRQSTTTAGR